MRRRTRGCGTISPFRDDDIVICTWAKSGTTWTQQIVGQLVFGGEPGLYHGQRTLALARLPHACRMRSNSRAAQTHRRLPQDPPADRLAASTRRKRSTSTSGATGATPTGAGTTTSRASSPGDADTTSTPSIRTIRRSAIPTPTSGSRFSSGSIATPIRTGRSGRTSRAGSTRGTCPTSSLSTSPISRPTFGARSKRSRHSSRSRSRRKPGRRSSSTAASTT